MLLVIAIVGTTVAPWQLFFQQSNIVDKRITPRWINYERVDTFLGQLWSCSAPARSFASRLSRSVARTTSARFNDAGTVGTALNSHDRTRPPAAFFAVVLLNASLIGAGAVTLATSYVMGDVFGTRGSLHRSFSEAKGFYAVFIALSWRPPAIVLIPGAPLGVIIEAVQALCGIAAADDHAVPAHAV